MFGFKECRIYPEPSLRGGEIRISAGNSLGLLDGDQVQLRVKDWQQRAHVTLVVSEGVAARDQNNVMSGGWTGDAGTSGVCRRVGLFETKWHVFRTSKRAWLGLTLAGVAIALAYVNAGLQQNGTMVWHLGEAKSIVFALSALTALLMWSRDTWFS